MTCVESSHLSILWEWDQTEFFKPGRGIRQGDPVSPYLFVLCMVRLSHIIYKAVQEVRWKGIKTSRNGPTISHLFFANDMVLFTEANESQVDTVLECLNWFCTGSCQKVMNLTKSQICFSNNVNPSFAGHLAERTGIPITKDLGKYLGVPSIQNRVTESTYSKVLEKVKARLEGCKSKHLSLAGRQLLAQSVLSTIP